MIWLWAWVMGVINENQRQGISLFCHQDAVLMLRQGKIAQVVAGLERQVHCGHSFFKQGAITLEQYQI